MFLLQRFRCQGHDLHVLLVTKFACNRTEDTRTAGRAVVVDQNSSILVELDVAAVSTTNFLLNAHHDTADDFALLNVAVGHCFLNAANDDIAEARVTALGAAQDLDALHLASAGVVSNGEHALHLNHVLIPFDASK